MRSLAIESLSVRGFRNLTSLDVALGPGFNVISGDNGQGKTNVLESVYVLATSRSFRTVRLTESSALSPSNRTLTACVSSVNTSAPQGQTGDPQPGLRGPARRHHQVT